MSKFYLGVDGGQSSTVALICNEQGRIVGHGRGGPCNHVSGPEGREKFFQAVGGCLHLAGLEACFDPRIQEFAAACLGFSGGAEDKVGYTKELIKSGRYHITHDAEIALTGATGGEPGIITIAGTGSIAFGRNADGKMARAGGWGYIFGDEGGAFDIARQAVRAALYMEEGWGTETILLERLLHATKSATASQLLHQFYAEFDRVAIARLAPLVTAAAQEGDPSALQILEYAAHDLANLAIGANRMLFHRGQLPAVSFIGGVFESSFVLTSFKREIRSDLGVEPVAPLYPPAAGALLQALRLDGNSSRLSNLPDIKQ
jgi:N-acetylglucosamine kinase-like BadF-type ATPase